MHSAVSLYECVEHLFQADLKEEACLWILFKLLTPLCFLWYISAVFWVYSSSPNVSVCSPSDTSPSLSLWRLLTSSTLHWIMASWWTVAAVAPGSLCITGRPITGTPTPYWTSDKWGTAAATLSSRRSSLVSKRSSLGVCTECESLLRTYSSTWANVRLVLWIDPLLLPRQYGVQWLELQSHNVSSSGLLIGWGLSLRIKVLRHGF